MSRSRLINETRSGMAQRQVNGATLKNGVASYAPHTPVHRQPYYENLGYNTEDFPEAEQFHREAITIPTYPLIFRADQNAVVECLKRGFR